MPDRDVPERRPGRTVIASATVAERDELVAYVGTVLRHLEAHYAADRWDLLMYLTTYLLVLILLVSG